MNMNNGMQQSGMQMNNGMQQPGSYGNVSAVQRIPEGSANTVVSQDHFE